LEELFFRAMFSILWLVFFISVTVLYYSAKGSAPKQTTSHEGGLRSTALVLAAIYFGGALLYLLLPGRVMVLSIPFPDSFRLIMFGAAILCLTFVLWAYRAIGKNWSPSVSGVRKDTSLVTTGPYGFVRHPIYLGIFVSLSAMALMAANLLVLLPTVALLIALYASIDEEEAILLDRFGDEYREYKKHTPKVIPKVR